MSLGSDLWVLMSVHTRGFADLTGVTLADEDSNSIPADNVNRAILGNVAMRVSPKLELMQAAPLGDQSRNYSRRAND